ncbi:unnamed protein product [Urochloa decumbens]|uniref:DUF3615 domain-containing protein n=1 Tax=Urochloa decumbens TaxID=240449 RepID=A0ABC9DUU8_9POAL
MESSAAADPAYLSSQGERRRGPPGEKGSVEEPWTLPTLLDVLPELSAEEEARLRVKGLLPGGNFILWTAPSRYTAPCLGEDYKSRISTVCDAVDHYNARHPGDEFDVVRPLMEDGLYFGDQVWLHMNFWARSRNSKKIKRFFAEVHYKPSPWVHKYSPDLSINVVESCCSIEEPLARYRNSCPGCRGYFDILHPMDDRQFVCGNGNANDWMVKDFFGIRFISRRDPADPNSQG